MLIPNLTCEIAAQGPASLTGRRSFGSYKVVPVAIVKLETSVGKTSVRTDSSATRGAATEIEAAARLLFPAFVMLYEGDRIRILDTVLSVQSVRPRHNVLGKLDHWQVDCEIYQGKL